MKKIILALCMTVLLITMFQVQACAEPVSAVTRAIDILLTYEERDYACICQARDVITQFANEPNYLNLVNARIRCDEVLDIQQRLRIAQVPSFGALFTDEEIDALLERGVELEVFEQEFETLAEQSQQTINTLHTLNDGLYLAAYDEKETALLAEKAERKLHCAELTARFLLAEINYLLLPVSADPAVAAFWNSIPESHPYLADLLTQWEDDGEALMDTAVGLLSDLEVQNQEILGEIGYAEHELERSRTGAFLESLRSIPNMPAMLPLPAEWDFGGISGDDWYSPDHPIYAEEDPDRVENILKYNTAANTAEMQGYIDRLNEWGAAAVKEKQEEDGSFHVYLEYNDSLFMVGWDSSMGGYICYTGSELSFEEEAYIAAVYAQ